jgi:protein O-mannosyl-transferase
MNHSNNHLRIRDFFLHSWHPYLVLTIIGFLLYLPIFSFSEYTYLDDHFLIVESYSHIDKISDVGHAFLEDVSHQYQGGNLYRPLLMVSLILSAQLSGTAPWGYHLIDILLHCACCCLLFAVLQILGFKRQSSFIASLFFCIHPVITQAVAWIPGRNDSLLAVFILSAFIAYTKFLSSSSLKWYSIQFFCFTFAMFTKESAIVFPFLALWYSVSLQRKKILSLQTIFLLAGWGIIVVNWHVLRSAAQIVPIGDKLQAAAEVFSNFRIVLFYLGKIFWPFDLSYAPILSDIRITAGVVSLGLLIALLIIAERKAWKLLFFGILWFIAFLIPTFFRTPKFCEHRIYIPFMGILIVLLSLSFTHIKPFLKRGISFIGAMVFCVLVWLSYTHAFDFKNNMSLIEFDARSSPNDLGRYNVITRMYIPQTLSQKIHSLQGISQQFTDTSLSVPREELWNVIDILNLELRLNLQNPELHHALAVAYFARGFLLSSEKNFLIAMQKSPNDPIIPYNLGILYYTGHEMKKAEESWLEALRRDSLMGKAYLNLSYLYYEIGQNDLARVHCQKAMQCGIHVIPEFIKEIQKEPSPYTREE